MAERVYFPHAKAAREALRERLVELMETQMRIISGAIEKGEFEVAAKANQFLLERAPADDDGIRVLDTSIDKHIESDGHKGPMIQIGIALGTKKELPPAIDVEIVNSDDTK